MALVAQITDNYLSSEIKLLKEQAANAARLLSMSAKDNWQSDLERLYLIYDEYIGMAILDESGTRLAHAGELPAAGEIIFDEYVSQAFAGNIRFSSSVTPLSSIASRNPGNASSDDPNHKVVFYLAAPIPAAGMPDAPDDPGISGLDVSGLGAFAQGASGSPELSGAFNPQDDASNIILTLTLPGMFLADRLANDDRRSRHACQ